MTPIPWPFTIQKITTKKLLLLTHLLFLKQYHKLFGARSTKQVPSLHSHRHCFLRDKGKNMYSRGACYVLDMPH